MDNPKVLYFDIESAGVNALHSDLGFVIVFGYKWGHEKQTKAIAISKKDLRDFNDRNLLIQASALFEQADLVVAHFGSVFDRRFIQGRLLIHKLPPIPPTKMRDTCMISRSVANFSSNRLKNLAKVLNLRQQKAENNWPIAWFEVMKGNMKHLKSMAEYCKQDVRTLEELYLRLRPFDNAAPRLIQDRAKCGACGGKVQYRGFAYIKERKYRRFQCTACSKWGRATKSEPLEE